MPYLASLIATSLLLAIGFSLSSGVVEGLVAIAGAIFLNTTLLVALGAWMAFPQIMLFTLLCGGGYGLVFGLLFSLSGGLELPKSNEARLSQ